MDVVVVGSCMTDLVSFVKRLPKPGETLIGDEFKVVFGGKGANQCVAAARLGAKTAMVARVGDDTFGQNIIENFKQNGVNADHVRTTKDVASGVATINVTESGENAIVVVCGANDKLSVDDVIDAEPLISSAKVVVSQLETKQATSLAALKVARKHGVTTILNAAPAVSDLDSAFYENCSILCVNETEAELLTGRTIASIDDARTAATALLDRGPSTVLLTLGAQGSLIAVQGHPIDHIPTRCVKAVDTTGAGDAFVGALAFYLAKYPNLELLDVVTRANEIATTSVLKAGTQTSFPHRDVLSDVLFR